MLIPGILLAEQAEEKTRVATLSTVLTEIATEVGAEHVAVSGLIPPGTDPHEYEPKPADLTKLAEAGLILASGKNLEANLSKLVANSGSRGLLVSVGDKFPSLELPAEDGGHGSTVDPHWWNSIKNVELATAVVRDALIQVDPAHAVDYRKNAVAYLAELAVLERWAKLKISELPRDQRKLVTSHDAFQYFAKDFGFTIYAVEGISPEDEASNRRVTNLIDTIKRKRVKAIFGEFGSNPKVLEVITRDTGAKIGGNLYADGLAPGDASTYAGMVRHNLTTIVEGLK